MKDKLNLLDFTAKRIKYYQNKMYSIYLDIQFNEEHFDRIKTDDPLIDADYQYDIEEAKQLFIFHYKNFTRCIQIFIEAKGLKEYLKIFNNHLNERYHSDDLILSGSFNFESGESYSIFLEDISTFLKPFPEFENQKGSRSKLQHDISTLEGILKKTSIIVKKKNMNPTTETQVYNAVKDYLEIIFDVPIIPSEAFIKTAKAYKPDILLPHLKCAIEYKYAKDENKLIETIDQILVDVKGYDKNASYNLFYAVFYAKPGIWTKKKFKTVWNEKGFPKNWKSIFVVGH